jgi:hypothetical protein
MGKLDNKKEKSLDFDSFYPVWSFRRPAMSSLVPEEWLHGTGGI